MSDLGNAALDLAAKGYCPFPCRRREKQPITLHGWLDATRDEAQIREWWGAKTLANIALSCELSGFSALDIDTKHGADPDEVVRELALDGYEVIQTGPAPPRSDQYPNSLEGRRGAQIWFRGELPTGDTSIPGVEIRGLGAYVMAPPSIHPSGVPYEGNPSPVADLPPIPDSVRAIATAAASSGRLDVAETIQEGGRHVALLSLGGTVRKRGAGEDELRTYMHAANAARCEPPLEDKEVERLLRYLLTKPIPDPDQASQNGAMPKDRGVFIRTYEAGDARAVRWLMKHRVPLGKLTALAGWQGQGKGLWGSWLIARVTRGELDADVREPMNVLFVAREETVEDEILPRLIAAGADLRRVGFLEMTGDDSRPFSIPGDLDALSASLDQWPVGLVWIDPVLGTVEKKFDSYKAQDVRHVLEPLGEVIRKHDTACIPVLHFNKSTSTNALVKIAESSAFTQVARSVLLLSLDPEAEDRENSPDRVLLLAKKNLAPADTPGWKYTIEGVALPAEPIDIETARMVYKGESFVTAREALDDQGSQRSALEDAKEFLAAELTHGPRPASELQKAAKAAGHSWETVKKRAKKALQVESERVSVEGGEKGAGEWVWKLPVQVPEGVRTEARRIRGENPDRGGHGE